MSEPTNTQTTSLALPDQGKQSAEIIRSSARQARLAAFTPANMTEVLALAKMMAGSDMVPKAYQRKPANIFVAIQFGSEIGLAAMQSLQSIAVINGNPSLWGDAALALVQAHPDFEDISETTEGTMAVCVVKRKNRTPVKRTFSDEDAKQAGLLTKGGTWNQYRQRMRQLRARGFALRDSFADVLKGIKIAEEVLDIPEQTSDTRQTKAIDLEVLQPSSEPNRGHYDEGLTREQAKSFDNASTPKQDEQVQKAAKESVPVMCGSCGKTGGHEEGCKYAEQDKKTAQFKTVEFILKGVNKDKKTTGGKPYVMLSVEVAETMNDAKLYVWHDHLKELFKQVMVTKPVKLIAEVSEGKEKNKVFWSVEHVINLADTPFVDDKPAMPAVADGDLFSE